MVLKKAVWARIQTCKWLATFSLVKPGTFINSKIFFGTASAENIK
jgi:hypothetical protein